MLDDVVDVLACPHCGVGLASTGRQLHCAHGHSFDVARHGYVSLLPSRGRNPAGDTAGMIAARAEFLRAGHYAPITDAVAARAADLLTAAGGGHVVDVGAGTGHYLAAGVDRVPEATGVALDVSKYAARRAARAHPRVGAVVADVWRALPVLDGAASVVVNVFAPRNAAEMHRILRPGGHLVLVTPNSDHLGELVDALDLVGVDEHKPDRLSRQLDALFEPVDRTSCAFTLSLRGCEAENLVGMGPSAWHAGTDSVRDRIAAMPEPIGVAASVTVSVYRSRPGDTE